MSDEAKKDPQEIDRPKRKALLDFWIKKWTKDRQVVVFSSTDEAMDACLPTLATMSELARRVTGCEIKHYGMGVFGAKSYTGQEIFSFCGGGAMQQDPAIDCSYTILTIRKESRRLVIKILREIASGGWEAVESEAAARKAAREVKVVKSGQDAVCELLDAAEAALDGGCMERLRKAVAALRDPS